MDIKYNYLSCVFFLMILTPLLKAQEALFTAQDLVRGGLSEERTWWDVQHYDLSFDVDIANQFIKGSNVIKYKVLREAQTMQIDLQKPMRLTSVLDSDGESISFEDRGDYYHLRFSKPQKMGSTQEIILSFEGNPPIAKRAPWDGGFTWSKDTNGKSFIATSCEGEGASLWWPNKDHLSDEPDLGVRVAITVPKDLVAVSNGRLIKTEEKGSKRTYFWEVINPINNYNVTLNVGDYTVIEEIYVGKKGDLDCTYYVLKGDKKKAEKHFKDVARSLEAFEHWFGPYPFYEDGYKLVQTPFLGMEHQSAIAYGNKFKKGYLGADISHTGHGLNFDYIIVHETGHEWFGNSISVKDIADLWIHEGFTTYSEALFLEYHYGFQKSVEYLRGYRINIINKKPLIALYGLNMEGSSDMYPKGANLLHMLRMFSTDEDWLKILQGLNQTFYHKTTTSSAVEAYLDERIFIDLKPIFNQYLREKELPRLKIRKEKNKITYQWINCLIDFAMPIRIFNPETKEVVWLEPTTKKQTRTFTKDFVNSFIVDANFYVDILLN